jgi:hypothetical protein
MKNGAHILEDEGTLFLRNVRYKLPNLTASSPRGSEVLHYTVVSASALPYPNLVKVILFLNIMLV